MRPDPHWHGGARLDGKISDALRGRFVYESAYHEVVQDSVLYGIVSVLVTQYVDVSVTGTDEEH